MADRDPSVTTHLISHMSIAYDPEHLALRLSVPAKDIRHLSPEAREVLLETVVDSWKQNCPEWRLEELLLTLRPEES